MRKTRKRLGDLLIETGLLTPEQLEKALNVQKKTNERLGRVLINQGYLSEESMIEVLEFQLGVPHVDLINVQLDKEAGHLIPSSLAEKYQVIPIKKEGRKLTLAMVDPTNFFAIDDVRMVSGCDVEPVIAAERAIQRAISAVYGVTALVEKAVNQLRPEEAGLTAEVQTADDAPIIGIVNSLFSQAVRERASDIHIEPQDKTLRVRFRIDGVLREISSFPRDLHAAIISRIKIMSDMDIAEKRLPQDGRIKLREAGREIDIRVSTLPTILGEKAVMRILDKKAVILDIKKLGFSPENLRRYQNLFTRSYGMILVTGPTGSGKTTTLYSTLTELNSPGKNIITVEDPVEYRLEGVNQVQVNQKAGLTFAGGLRSILRQDPNIVMIGEIRDRETADIAVRAALTGHLVLSTLHTNDAPGAVTRLIDMGVEPFLVASSVLGVVAQRLIRLICPECKRPYHPAPDSTERVFLGIEPQRDITLYRGTGCSACGRTGYRGRMSIHEVMPVSAKIRELINLRVAADEIGQTASQESMLSMREDGIQKALTGLTTVEEVMRVAYAGI
ncbi:type ii secretion system protein e [Lucifera butyrica]|uniref:protein-secreting ATPase n=1 Tax=Lucifera butyrica TaxID=1351585 RepID=A0A498R650_9FIRM|nr:type II secretion system ATPase GspE [Lucifera butyrica]VBB06881.1 type ii secretion system protein e [Lucifera butyrica]